MAPEVDFDLDNVTEAATATEQPTRLVSAKPDHVQSGLNGRATRHAQQRAAREARSDHVNVQEALSALTALVPRPIRPLVISAPVLPGATGLPFPSVPPPAAVRLSNDNELATTEWLEPIVPVLLLMFNLALYPHVVPGATGLPTQAAQSRAAPGLSHDLDHVETEKTASAT